VVFDLFEPRIKKYFSDGFFCLHDCLHSKEKIFSLDIFAYTDAYTMKIFPNCLHSAYTAKNFYLKIACLYGAPAKIRTWANQD
jgi:hypothetical protein